MLNTLKSASLAFGIIVVLSLGVFAFVEPIAQDPGYHDFADRRRLFGMPNFFDVVSNLAFLWVGWIGFRELLRQREEGFRTPARAAFLLFFVATFGIGLGSAYYHWAPDNERLVWDRLPMSIAFMALFCAFVSEYVDLRLGRILLVPLAFVGVASVLYWHWTELQGRGDLRLYGLVQFLTLAAIPLVMAAGRPSFSHGKGLLTALLYYCLAKLAEWADPLIFAASGVISGHTAKHLLSAYAIYVLLLMLRVRSRLLTEPG